MITISIEKPQHSTRETFEIYHAVDVKAAIKMEYYLESKDRVGQQRAPFLPCFATNTASLWIKTGMPF